MRSIDPALQSAVWARVTGTACQAGAPAGPLTAQELLSLMQYEKNDCAAYRSYARMAGGRDAQLLCRIAADEADHYRRLHAMYFLLTGKCACLQAEKPSCTACLTEALRSAYALERRAAETYEKAARRWPEMADELTRIADDEARHARELRALICRRL